MSRKILFLDIDGVLNTSLYGGGFGIPLEEDKLEILDDIIEEVSCQIVITSTHRVGKSVSKIRKIFSKSGLENSGAIIDKTPRISSRDRSDEIRSWLEWNKEVDEFVVVDDRDLSIENHVITVYQDGLTEEKKKEVLRKFDN